MGTLPGGIGGDVPEKGAVYRHRIPGKSEEEILETAPECPLPEGALFR